MTSGEDRGNWWDVVRRRDITLDMPSVGDPRGEGLEDSLDSGIRIELPDDCELGRTCSDSAVVAVAFAGPVAPKGIRAPENFVDDVDCREALDPGLKVPDILEVLVFPSCGVDTDALRVGDGGGGEVLGNGDLSEYCVTASGEFSACANSRDNDDGAVGEEPGRGGDGNSREVGGRVTVKDSSTSASGGPVGVSGDTSVAGVDISDEVPFLCEMRRLDGWVGCVQSSTSNM